MRKTTSPASQWRIVAWIFLALFTFAGPRQLRALGVWTNVVQLPPGQNGVEHLLLLPDGTVMAQQQGTSSVWYRLTPDRKGSYVNGSWSTLAPMIYTRQYYASTVLRDGRVFVAGGEYGTPGGNKAEIYDPRLNTWTEIPVPAGLICTNCPSPGISDADSIILPDGRVLIAPVLATAPNGTIIFDPFSNTFSQGPSSFKDQNEATWVKLPDDSILTIDPTKNPNLLNTSERFIPSLNNGQGGWIQDADLTVTMYNFAQEIGAGVLLPDGRAFFIGGNGHTAYYTPSGNLSNGVWTPGPELVAPGVGWDEPAAMMVNGKVLFQTALGPPANPQPRAYYEMDPNVNYPIGQITQAPAWGDNSGTSHIMLNLPDGNVLVSYGSSTLRVYIPGGAPTPAGKPTISNIAPNGDGSYHLTGTKLNGISQGSSFGDDAQMDSNYPLVRITDHNGDVYYLPTYNWSSTGVNTGTRLVTTEFFPFQRLTPGEAYSLVVVANGISSDPVTFYGPTWVDLNAVEVIQNGSFDFPYHTLAQGISAVPVSGSINFKTAGSIKGPTTLSKPMSLVAVGGLVTIGN